MEWLITAKKGQVPERAIGTKKDNYARSKGRLSFFIAMPGRKSTKKQPFPGVSLFPVYLRTDEVH